MTVNNETSVRPTHILAYRGSPRIGLIYYPRLMQSSSQAAQLLQFRLLAVLKPNCIAVGPLYQETGLWHISQIPVPCSAGRLGLLALAVGNVTHRLIGGCCENT